MKQNSASSANPCAKYPKYKPSGVEWLGDVPEHWDALPIKRIVAIPITDGPHETPEILDEGIPFVSAESIRNNRIDFSRKRGFISESEHRRFCLKYHPKRGDIYMIKSGATTGNLAIVETDEEFSIWSPLAVIRVHKKKADARFILLAMNSKEFQTSVQLFWSFGTQQNIGMNVIENLPIPLPPLPEQQAIAAFLDRETGRIDALIAKKARLLELLAEQRTALISRAVTKGLGGMISRGDAEFVEWGEKPVKFKPSGVEWLGDVPEHWEVKKLKYISSIRYGIGEPPEYVDDGVPLIRATNINSGKIEEFNLVKVNPKNIPYSRIVWLKSGDIIVVRSGAYTGDSSIIPDEYSGAIAGFDMVLSCTKSYSKFIAFGLLSKYLKDGQIYLQKLRAAQPHLNAEELGDSLVILPPLPEQQAIAAFLDRETAKIDALSVNVSAVIERLKEYRTALISSAVTGKIDVRGEL